MKNFRGSALAAGVGTPESAPHELRRSSLHFYLGFKHRNWDNEVTENIIYQKLLSDKLASDLGYVYENVIAQMLRAKGDKLYYHTWPTPSGKHNYEIDFLISRGFKLCPIEVKSSGYKAHVSMDEFCKKFSQHIGLKYLLYTKDLRKDGDLWLLPVYMTLFI